MKLVHSSSWNQVSPMLDRDCRMTGEVGMACIAGMPVYYHTHYHQCGVASPGEWSARTRPTEDASADA